MLDGTDAHPERRGSISSASGHPALAASFSALARESVSAVRSRANAARTLALTASRLARDRLEECRRERKGMAALAAAIGSAGLMAWAVLLLTQPDNAHAALAIGSLAALAQCAPLVLCISRIMAGPDPEENIAVAIEDARMLASQAERLGEAVETASDDAAWGPATHSLVNFLLHDIEQATAVAHGHERRIRGSAIERSRRHIRIKPRHDRVILTTHDSRKLTVTIIDVSRSGVAVQGNVPNVPIGAEVVVGSRKAKAVRMLPRGMAFEFLTPIPAGLLDADIVL